MEFDQKLIPDYIGTINGETEEAHFLRSFPWYIGTHPQDVEHLRRGLWFEVSRFVELPIHPVFSLITYLRDTPPRFLQELILSVRCQSWLRWELILVDDGSNDRAHLQVARDWADRDERIRVLTPAGRQGPSAARNVAIGESLGSFVAILDQADILHPSALGIFARRLNSNPDANFLYSNEARISDATDRVSGHLSKPLFDLFTLLRINYVGHFTAIRRDLLLTARREGTVFRPRHDGVEDHDLFLRIALTGQINPVHVPLCLYYSRVSAGSVGGTTSDRVVKQIALLDELMPELYPGARWEARPPAPETGSTAPRLRIRSLALPARPSLLVLVPFKNNLAITLKCVQSIERQRHDLDLHVLLINNRSTELTPDCELMQWLAQPRDVDFQLVDHDGPFNYAKIHNRAINRFGGGRDLLLFLNNDVELLAPECLQILAMQLLADDRCAFVGIKLDFPDGQGVQHGGIRFPRHSMACGFYGIDHAQESTEFVNEERIAPAVTFACAMVRREVYEQLGRLEEVLLPNAYGDVDIGLRALERGYRNYYFGSLLGIHHETKSRGRSSEESEFVDLHERHGQTLATWKNRSLSLSHETWPPVIIPEPTPAPPAPLETPVTVPFPPIPLRYKVADRLNQALKITLGPAHGAIKQGVLLARKPHFWRRRARQSR